MPNLPRKYSNVADPLYARMAADIATLIENGTMRPGDRIPSVRNASRQHKVSVGTAIQAYLALENRGLVEALQKLGFFVCFQARRLLEPQTSRPSLRATSIDSSTLLTRFSRGHPIRCRSTRRRESVNFIAACAKT